MYEYVIQPPELKILATPLSIHIHYLGKLQNIVTLRILPKT